MPDVTFREWRWVIILSLLIVLGFSLPYIVGYAHSTPAMTFSGFLFGLEDMFSYLAKMRFGARDGWEFRLVYTSEPHQGGLVFLPFLALGKLTAALSGQGAQVSADALIAAYQIARVVCGFLLLVTTYRFIAEFVSEVPQRRLAWVLASLGGGLGWLTALFAPGVKPLSGFPVEFYVPEGFSTLLIYGLPHLALARSLLLGGWLLLFASIRRADWKTSLLAGLAWLGMGLCVPFYGALLGVLIGAWLVGFLILNRRIPSVELRHALIAGLLPAVYLAYNVWLFTTNPIFAIWSSQNWLPSPPLPDYLMAYGLLIALAVPGAVVARRSGLDRQILLLVMWPLVAALMVYLPINIQRRLLEGAFVPLCVLAVHGVGWLTRNQKAPVARRAASISLLTLLLPSTILLLAGGVIAASSPAWPVFHPADELAALGWLHDHAPFDSVVMSTRSSGMVLPAYAGVRVFVGHGPETVHADDKEMVVEGFLANPLSEPDPTGALSAYPIDYIWIGPPERAVPCKVAGCVAGVGLPGWQPVFTQGSYTIYQVGRR